MIAFCVSAAVLFLVSLAFVVSATGNPFTP